MRAVVLLIAIFFLVVIALFWSQQGKIQSPGRTRRKNDAA
jgi:hypothetical protein